ncbi:MAG TPA: hypothetical protein DIT19_02955 [Desulfonauticus sp.]|jgi:biopolymer transport protein ExbB/TolQ|nr:MAG: Uncharacterized protein XD41_1825 [Desulfonauticus sp. 38_4375]MDK2921149.1 hypothetical protein [Desulfonauticus sp.]HCO12166.1 hypothetical protein [Desulfonauticus sp.]
MNKWEFILLILSFLEVILLILVIFFFLRLKKSEKFLKELQQKQEDFIQKLSFSSQLEKELVESFALRQEELLKLEEKLSARSEELRRLILQAEKFTNSPLFLRQVIIMGHKAGESIESLAKNFGLTQEEVELILEHQK